MNAAIYTTTDNKLAYQLGERRAVFNGKAWGYQKVRNGAWADVRGCNHIANLVAQVKTSLGK